jgi:hypothetical protein
MPNKSIYTNHYVYLIEHIHSGKYYIGVRSTKLKPEDDLGKKYFSSSRDKEFKKDQKLNKDHYKYAVLKEFDNRNDAVSYEIFLHDLYKVSHDHMSYNKAMHTSTGFCTNGMMVAKDIDGNIFHVSVDDPRLKTGELVGVNAGMMAAKDIDGNIYRVSVNDERLKTGELVGVAVGMMAAKDIDGNTYFVSVNDERLKTGELVSVNAGMIQVYDNNDKRHSINKDDYDPDVFYRIPNDHKRCKDTDGNIVILYKDHKKIKNNEVQVAKPAVSGKDTYLVFPDDPRLETGELVGIFTGMRSAKDANGNILQVSVDDERLKTGELVGITAGMIQVYDNNDKRHSINKDDYDPDVYYRIPMNHKRCKDTDDNIFILYTNHKKIKNNEVQVAKPAVSGKDTYLVFPDDPRILDGTLKFKKKK